MFKHTYVTLTLAIGISNNTLSSKSFARILGRKKCSNFPNLVKDKDSSSRVNTTQSYIYFTIMLNKLPNCEAYNNEIVINK